MLNTPPNEKEKEMEDVPLNNEQLKVMEDIPLGEDTQ